MSFEYEESIVYVSLLKNRNCEFEEIPKEKSLIKLAFSIIKRIALVISKIFKMKVFTANKKEYENESKNKVINKMIEKENF